MRCGAANHGCSRLSRRLAIEHRKRSCCCKGETSLTGKRGRLKGGCSHDWLPHVAFPKTCKHPMEPRHDCRGSECDILQTDAGMIRGQPSTPPGSSAL